MAKSRERQTVIEVSVPEALGIVDAGVKRALSEGDAVKLKSTIQTLCDLVNSDYLSSEKMKKLLPSKNPAANEGPEKNKPPGHGRNGPEMFSGADKHEIGHEELQSGCVCPGCNAGKVYRQKKPRVLVRLTAEMPIQGDVYELESLRCNRCGQVYVAQEPDGVGPEKYDESVGAMLALLHYGAGMPFNRLEKLQSQVGIPLPASDQWEIVQEAADLLEPIHSELKRQAAQAAIIQNDDTSVKIIKQERPAEDKRTGTFTTGIVATTAEKRKIALFETGRQHAGENLADVLQARPKDLPPVVQMSDALSRNVPKRLSEGVEILWANCMDHGRRHFVYAVDGFPEQCRYVLEMLGKVYAVDRQARQQELNDKDRLQLHQRESEPVMKELRKWMKERLADGQTEPNSKFGKAIAYMLNHWQELTLFLRHPGAPLSNVIVERALKKAILLRKNSLFYRTAKGAGVGDLFLSLIHTCELNGINAFDYLHTLLRNPVEIRENPAAWMPWSYVSTAAGVKEPAVAVPDS